MRSGDTDTVGPSKVDERAGRGAGAHETYIGLDLVRFAAALSVAVYHLGFWWWLPAQAGESGAAYRSSFEPIAATARWGYVGVPVFFVISGFIIAASAVGRTPRQFIRSRILRLYPAVWLCTPLLLLATTEISALAAATARTLVLWPTGPWLSGVLWTLAVEIAFYALIAASLAVKIPLWWTGAAFGAIGSAYWILRAVDFMSGRHAEPLFSAVEQSTLGSLFVVQACFFGVGIATWAIRAEGASALKVALFLMFVLAGSISTYAGGRFALAEVDATAGAHAYDPTIGWLVATLLILLSVWLQPPIWERFGRWGSAARNVGLATYPLYLIHSELGRAMMRGSALDPWPAFFVALTGVCGIAFGIVWLERWPRRILANLFHWRVARRPSADLP